MMPQAVVGPVLPSCASHWKILPSASPPSVLAYQQPNAKKLRRKAQRAEQLAAKGVVTRRQKQLLNRRSVDRAAKKSLTQANNNPDRDFYDIWGQECECCMCVHIQWWSYLCTTVFPSWECEEKRGAQMTVVWTAVWDLRINYNQSINN